MADPYQDEQYANQEAEAYAAYAAALSRAADAWFEAEAAAYSVWEFAIQRARSEFELAEAQAWNTYGDSLSRLVRDLEPMVRDLESAFKDSVAAAEQRWQQQELEAWENYVHAYSLLVAPRTLGERFADLPIQVRLDAGVSLRDLEGCCCCGSANFQGNCSSDDTGDESQMPTADLLLPVQDSFGHAQTSCSQNTTSEQDSNSHIDYYPIGMSLVISATPAQSGGVRAWIRRYVVNGLMMVGGALEVVGGAGLILSPDPSLTTKGAGTFLVFHGWDNLRTGWCNMLDGKDRETFTQSALRYGYEFVLPPEHAERAAIYTDIGLSMGAGFYSSAKAITLHRAYDLTAPTRHLLLAGEGSVVSAAGKGAGALTLESASDVANASRRWVIAGDGNVILGTRVGPRLPAGLEDRFMFSRRLFTTPGQLKKEWLKRFFGHESGLLYHESLGGHTISKHVGKSLRELLQRLEAEPNLPTVSTFRSLDEAENYIARVLEAHADKIADWLRQTGQEARSLALQTQFSEPVGQVLARGASQLQGGHKVRVVLFRDSKSALGFRIQTAYIDP